MNVDTHKEKNSKNLCELCDSVLFFIVSKRREVMKRPNLLSMLVFCGLLILLNPVVFSQTNFWQQTNGPYIGAPARLFSDACGGITAVLSYGVYRSLDEGASWTQVNPGFSVYKIMQSIMASSGSLFAVADGPWMFRPEDGPSIGLYRSTDNGTTWTLLRQTGYGTSIQADLGYIFLTTYVDLDPPRSSLLRSADDGESWTTRFSTDYGGISLFLISGNLYLVERTYVGYTVGYRSTDYGDTWTQLGYMISAFYGGPGRLVFATSFSDVSPSGALARSTDDGASWKTVLAADSGVAFYGVNPRGHVFAATRPGGLHRSTDNGDIWSPIDSSQLPPRGVTQVDSATFLVVSAAGKVLRSTDSGDSWQETSSVVDGGSFYVHSPSSIFYVTPENSKSAGVLRSTDKGDTWKSVELIGQNTRVSALARAANGSIFAGTNRERTLYSLDSEKHTWSPIYYGSGNPIKAIGVNMNGDIFVGTGSGGQLWRGGISRSTDNGTSWRGSYGGGFYYHSRSPDIYAFAFNSLGHIFAATSSGIRRSTDNGASWAEKNYYFISAISVSHNDALYAGTRGVGVVRSTDNGDTWTAMNNRLADLQVYSLTSNSFGHIFAGTSTAPYRSTDNGDSWTLINVGMPTTVVQALAVNAAGDLYAGTTNYVYCSTDNGDTWTQLASGLTNNDVRSLVFDNDGVLYAGTWGGGVFRSAETRLPIQLTSFTARLPGSMSVALRWSTVSETNNYGFYVQRRPADEAAFVELPNSFVPGHGTTIEHHEYSYTDNHAIAGRSYYRLKQVDLDGTAHFSDPVQVSTAAAVPEVVPVEFALRQNFPNPFNPTTEIRYEIRDVGFVSLKVYDVLGREVATLVSENLAAGRYKAQWDATGMASGIYFYRLQSDNRVETRKAFLIK